MISRNVNGTVVFQGTDSHISGRNVDLWLCAPQANVVLRLYNNWLKFNLTGDATDAEKEKGSRLWWPLKKEKKKRHIKKKKTQIIVELSASPWHRRGWAGRP